MLEKQFSTVSKINKGIADITNLVSWLVIRCFALSSCNTKEMVPKVTIKYRVYQN